MNRWAVHELKDSLGEFTDAWASLHGRIDQTNPLTDTGFVSLLLTNQINTQIYLCTLVGDASVEAMLLLREERTGVWTSSMPGNTGAQNVLIANPDAIAGLFGMLPGIPQQISIYVSNSSFLVQAATRKNTVVDIESTVVSRIGLTDNFDEYWKTRPKSLIRELAASDKKLAASKLSTRFVATKIDTLSDVAHKTLPSASGPTVAAATSRVPKSQTDVARLNAAVLFHFEQTGSAWTFELVVGDKVAASLFAVAVAGSLVVMASTIDQSMCEYEPGSLLLRALIQYAYETRPGSFIYINYEIDGDPMFWANAPQGIGRARFTCRALALQSRQVIHALQQLTTRTARSADSDEYIVRAYSHPAHLPEDVKILFWMSEKQCLEFGLTWYRNLIDTVYPDHKGVEIHVLYLRNKPVAAMPILVSEDANNVSIKSLSNYYTALYSPAIFEKVDANALAHLILAIVRAHPRTRDLQLSPMDPDSSAYRLLLNSLNTVGYLTFEFYCFGNWYLKVDSDWDGYLKSRSATWRSNLKRASRKFETEGGTLEVVSDQSGLSRAIGAYEQVYAASWKIPEPYPEFVPGLISACLERGWLRLGIAWLGDRPIAAQIWIVAEGKAHIYKVAYDEAFKTYTPGTLLTAMLMQYVIEKDQVAEVDYLIGDDTYKKSWMGARRERWGIVVYNHKNIAGLLGLAREATARTVKPIMARIRGTSVSRAIRRRNALNPWSRQPPRTDPSGDSRDE